ncbi:MAG: DUF151 domain-containing protein [bacterium]|nr:DUF151 domain-containing protein [bacterium]
MDGLVIDVIAVADLKLPDHDSVCQLVLAHTGSRRGIRVAVTPMEAQGIQMVLSGMVPPRPLTHDLIRKILYEALGAILIEARVCRVENEDEGDMSADLVFLDSDGNERVVAGAMPGDAVALALRCNAPIVVSGELLDWFEAGMRRYERENRLERLKAALQRALDDERYEDARRLKREVDRRTHE